MGERPEGTAPDFVYTIYIAASAETVWNALMDREMTSRYWNHENRSDWKKGSVWEHRRADGSGVVDIRGHVVEIDPPKKLVVTWNAEDEEWGEPHPSQVTYDLIALGPDTKLTVTHAMLDEGSTMHKGVTEGWPGVLSNLKTLVETGRVLSEEQWPGDQRFEPPEDGTVAG